MEMQEETLQEGVGRRIRLARKKKGWSLEDLSQASGLHPSSISQVERGERNVTLRNLARLAEGLNLDPFQLLLTDKDRILNPDESLRFKVRHLLENATDNKKVLLYHLAKIIREWDPRPRY